MKLTMRAEYAVRALTVLAFNNDKPLSVHDLSKNYSLPYKFIEQIFRKLRQKNIITSTKGKNGGYKLSKDVNDITLKDIIAAVGESTMKISCLESDTQDFCIGKPCTLSDLWLEIKTKVDNIFENITLKMIIDRFEEIQ